MDDKATIGARVRRTRRALDITQADLAARIGVAHTTIVRIERGKAAPRTDTLFKLADALGVDPKWIVAGGDDTDDRSPHAKQGESR